MLTVLELFLARLRFLTTDDFSHFALFLDGFATRCGKRDVIRMLIAKALTIALTIAVTIDQRHLKHLHRRGLGVVLPSGDREQHLPGELLH
jgi:hypothetical protein